MEEKRIKIRCKQCKSEFMVRHTEEIPKTAIEIVCNWCPTLGCVENDYYKETYRYAKRIKPINQTKLL